MAADAQQLRRRLENGEWLVDLRSRTAFAAGHAPILDVRRHLEWAESHVDGSVHIPLHEMLARAGEVPPGELWVHCAARNPGIDRHVTLLANGHRVIAVDDDYTNAAAAGLPITSAADHKGNPR